MIDGRRELIDDMLATIVELEARVTSLEKEAWLVKERLQIPTTPARDWRDI